MKKLFLYFIFLYLISQTAFPTVLQFHDNIDLSIQENVIKNKKLHNSDSLYTYFRNLGFLDVSIDDIHDTLFVSSGIQYKLASIYIDSNKISQTLSQVYFTEEHVTTLFNELIQIEKNNGFQFASIRIDSTKIIDSAVDLYCSLHRGPQTLIETLSFEGLTKTEPTLLYKYLQFDDSILTPKLLQKIEEDASQIPFVTYLPPIKQVINPGYINSSLIIPFKEKENLIFEGGGGYLSETEQFVWNVELHFQNILGGGREISIISQKKDNKNQHLKIGYEQPLFMFGIGSAQFGIQTRDYRDQFYEFALNSKLQTYYKKRLYVGLGGQYKSVEQENENLSYRTAQVSFSITNSQLKSSFYRSQKFIYDWKLEFGNRKYKNDTSIALISPRSLNESRIEIQTKLFTLIKYPFISLIDLKFKSFQTGEDIPPLAELYLVGGTGSIRGFKDEQFPSIRNFIFTVEPQYQFESGNFFLFYDGGYIYNRTFSDISLFDEQTIYRYGYGGGILLSSNRNYIKISLGWNKNLKFDTPRISLELKSGL